MAHRRYSWVGLLVASRLWKLAWSSGRGSKTGGPVSEMHDGFSNRNLPYSFVVGQTRKIAKVYNVLGDPLDHLDQLKRGLPLSGLGVFVRWSMALL